MKDTLGLLGLAPLFTEVRGEMVVEKLTLEK